MARFRAVMVGVGGFGRELADATRDCRYFSIVGAHDSQNENMAKFKHTFDVKLYPTYRDVLMDKSVQGVVIATPNDTHRDLVEQATQAGKHIFVEKPIANTIEDARAIIKAAESAKVTLFVGHVARRSAASRLVKKSLEAKTLGKVVLIEGHIAHRGGMDLTPQTWRWYKERLPGGPVMQLAIHTIDTFNYLMGPVKSVSAKVARLATPAEIEDTAVIALEYESGVLGFIGTAYTVPSSTYTHIYGTEGLLSLEKGGEVTIKHRDGKVEALPPVIPVNARGEELDEFARCALTGAKPETGGEEGLQALAVVMATLKSSLEKRTVTIKEVLAG
jgi:predicted dehydrogenase